MIYQGGLLPDHEDAILTDTASPTGDDNDDDNDNDYDDDDVNDNNNDNDDDNDNDTAHFTDLVTACDQDSLRDNRGENIQENW